MIQYSIFSFFFMLWLVGCASADGGDDFANNLASDLGPILALFGERVVMQFMSQAMGIADCILLAVAPIGAITTVVSAIRVAGPAWLGSFIGRARENLSAAEIEVMSSTSKEACELWNGHSVVRCPGSADMYQFICLIPNECDAKTLSQKRFNIRYVNLKGVAIDTKTVIGMYTEKDTKEDIEKGSNEGAKKDSEKLSEKVTEIPDIERPKLLKQIKRTGPGYTWKCLKRSIRTFSNKLKYICRTFLSIMKRIRGKLLNFRSKPSDEERQDGSRNSTLTWNSEPPSPEALHLSNTNSTEVSGKEDEVEITIIVDNFDDSAPNLLLNCHDRVGRSEIYLAAAFGVILQLGAVVYFGVITYHKPIQNRFLKDGERVVNYAFPCAAIGTILLVFGLFTCAWVVGESTKETYYEAENHQMFVVWLQKDHTVSDQVFKPYAIYPNSKREYITTSRRNIEHHSKETRDFIRQIRRFIQQKLNKLTKDKAAESGSQSSEGQSVKEQDTNGEHNQTAGNRNDTNEQSWYWPLKFITFIGALISLIGFISQFIGMRGLNWTASIVQLGITIVVTILRVIVRRGLGKPPARMSLDSKFELDWFALSFGDLATAPWAMFDGKSGTSGNQNDASKDKKSSKWSIRTGGDQTYLPLKIFDTNSAQPRKDSTSYKIMLARKNLGNLSDWKSPVNEEAVRLSKAIEAVAETFLIGLPRGKYEWILPATYENENDSTKSAKDDIYINVSKGADDKWKVEEMEIEAILSLWLYSAQSVKPSETSRRRSLRLYGPSHLKERLYRDLDWWIPENAPAMSTYTQDNIDEITKGKTEVTKEKKEISERKAEFTVVGFKTDPFNGTETSKNSKENEPSKEYIGLECQDEQERFFSRDLLFSFIRTIAKLPEVTITSASNVHTLNYSKMAKGWKRMKLRNDAISELVRKLEKIGFGTQSDIYLDLIAPLSLEQKLTNVKMSSTKLQKRLKSTSGHANGRS